MAAAGSPIDAYLAGLHERWLREGSGAVAVVVTDPCPRPPVKRDPAADDGHGRGLHVVEGLSARWGWTPQDPGKAVYSIFTRQG